MARPIVLKFGVWVGATQPPLLHKSDLGCCRTCARAYPFFEISVFDIFWRFIAVQRCVRSRQDLHERVWERHDNNTREEVDLKTHVRARQ